MSGVGYMAGGDSEKVVKYNGYKFSKAEGGFMTYVDGKKIVLYNNPNELTNTTTGFADFNELNSAEKIYVSVNPEDNLGNYLFGLQYNLLNNLKPKKVSACYVDNELCKELPLKDCKDASARIKVILIRKGDTKIEYKDNCLIIQGKDEELVKFIDKLILNMFID